MYMGLVPGTSQQQTECTNGQIQQRDLSTCKCSGGNDQCTTTCSAGPDAPNCPNDVLSQYNLDHCSLHCGAESGHHCKACWIWFDPLCNCLQSGGCQQSSNNAPFWVKVNSEIITTSSPIPDILDLQTNHPSLAPFGWDFGQQSGVSDTSKDALVINSVHSITEDQIHMHVCPVNTGIKNFLGSLTPSQYYDLKDIQITGYTIYCRASHSAGQPVSGDVVAADINTVMGKECKYYVGAAVLRDKNDLAWSCVTADHLSTEYKRFCD
ncbi:hypothetical protein N7466_010020 [Penicillium verhagenii]|uniref:uncharacterized protein n=1 Tax=Penicillium verhagenii TaxID=1562060 RepID=UPI0025455DEB|nr:uncharacterized protein N7466_010020 [Penicillium verhagenii]KAJ5919077.1 hypothetical protein N7466_010020 [Penicillium verhagenii]